MPKAFTARWIAPLFGFFAFALLPWVVWLAKALPARHVAAHWNVAWAGFDLVLAAALLATAVAAFRRSPWLGASASAAGTLLLVDAWFDLLTSRGGGEVTLAAAAAVFVEVPIAILCFWIARDTERFLTRAQACWEAVRPQRATIDRRQRDNDQAAAAVVTFGYSDRSWAGEGRRLSRSSARRFSFPPQL